jgi:hypothetical protein
MIDREKNQRRLTIIELNEANLEILQHYGSRLPHLNKLLQMPRTLTSTDDNYDSGYLEPWVQWVSIHTGEPASSHKVKHLGDLPESRFSQLWERLSAHNVTSGIWGVMNGARRKAEHCLFFVADPWTFSADPFPDRLHGLTDFARYIAKNYCALNPFKMIAHAWVYGLALLQSCGFSQLCQASWLLVTGVFRFGPRHMVLGAFFEYLSTVAFVRYKKELDPSVSIVFLNLIAHIQHHHWKRADTGSAELAYGYKVMDMAVGEVLDALAKDELLLAINGLSQSNTNHEEAWIQYRQKDQEAFLQALSLQIDRVEALMTHDAHIFFASEALRERAFQVLSQGTVNGHRLFEVEKDAAQPTKLFYRLEFTGPLSPTDHFVADGKEYKFFEHFKTIIVRTGKHNQNGFAFQSERILPDQIINHQIYDHVCAFFGIPTESAATAPASASATTQVAINTR